MQKTVFVEIHNVFIRILLEGKCSFASSIFSLFCNRFDEKHWKGMWETEWRNKTVWREYSNQNWNRKISLELNAWMCFVLTDQFSHFVSAVGELVPPESKGQTRFGLLDASALKEIIFPLQSISKSGFFSLLGTGISICFYLHFIESLS